MSLAMPRVLYAPIEMKGGWDTQTPSLSLPPGVVRDCQNFEVQTTGGYSRIGGYERFDGQTRPSAATYSVVQVTSFTNTPTAGQTLTGGSSGATGTIIALGADYIVLTQVVGTFTDIEAVAVGATPIGTATALTATITSLLAAQYTNLAADVYRALISAPPGSGAVLGVAELVVSGVDNTFAFRANTGGTAVDVWKASAAGWVQVALKNEVSFTVGSGTTPADGATLTQGANTATIRRVMTQSGSWSGGTAAGRFIVDTPAPGAFAAGAATLSGATVTLSGAQTAITLLPGGKFEFRAGNFSGQLSTLRLYGADGVNRMFEFDGTYLCPIVTGASPDAPKHLVVHANYLVCSVRSSIMHCGAGTPFKWSAVDGGGEIATSDTVTGFLSQPGAQTTGALLVYGRNNTFMLYGVNPATWNFVTYNSGTGGTSYTNQNLDQSFVLDDRGVSRLATSLTYGNFSQATITHGIKTFITGARLRASCSMIAREKSQYRLFFSDGTGLYITVANGKLMGSMLVVFPTAANCAWSGERSDGSEVMYVGGANGQVYQLDKGSSFDGADIDAFITLAWNALRTPRVLKRFRHASVEMQGNFYAAIQFGYQLGYGTTEMGQPAAEAYTSAFSGTPLWDALTWDAFTWDGRTVSPTEIGLAGTAENIQVTISSTTDYIMPFTVASLILHYTPRRGMR